MVLDLAASIACVAPLIVARQWQHWRERGLHRHEQCLANIKALEIELGLIPNPKAVKFANVPIYHEETYEVWY